MYKSELVEGTREFTPIQILGMEDTVDMEPINDLENNYLFPPVTGYAIFKVHNDMLDDPDYETFVLITTEGNFYTSSKSFTDSVKHIWDILKPADGQEVKLKLKRIPSKNYKDREILSCKCVE